MTTTLLTKKNKTTNDPVSDFLTRVRNGLLVNKEQVAVPYSNLKLSLAELLKAEGYINDVKVVSEEDVSRKSIVMDMRYVKGRPAITGLKKISKPGLRKYTKAQYAPRVYSGLGISVISTSKGLITDRKARAEKVGGEILCQVW